MKILFILIIISLTIKKCVDCFSCYFCCLLSLMTDKTLTTDVFLLVYQNFTLSFYHCLFSNYYLYMSIHMYMWRSGDTSVESVLFTFAWVWRSNSGHQACMASALPTDHLPGSTLVPSPTLTQVIVRISILLLCRILPDVPADPDLTGRSGGLAFIVYQLSKQY